MHDIRKLAKELIAAAHRFQIRGYQLETIEETVSLLMTGTDAVLIEAPTGAGKTVMGILAAEILRQKMGARTIGWVAMRKNLLAQAAETAAMLGLDENIIPFSMFDKNPPEVDILVVDEAHHDATMSMVHIHKHSKAKKTIGLSATPIRSDKAELIFEKQVSRSGIYDLVRLGYLSKPDIFILPDWKVHTVVRAYLQDPQKWGKTVMFFFTMQECEVAAAALKKAGVPVEIVHAGSDREAVLARFESGATRVLVNMMILTEGFDAPDLETVFVRPSGRALTQQMAGRVLRVKEGIRKKIVQSQDSDSPFQKIAPVGRSFRFKESHAWAALDYDEELIRKLVKDSNGKIKDSMARIPQETKNVIKFFGMIAAKIKTKETATEPAE